MTPPRGHVDRVECNIGCSRCGTPMSSIPRLYAAMCWRCSMPDACSACSAAVDRLAGRQGLHCAVAPRPPMRCRLRCLATYDRTCLASDVRPHSTARVAEMSERRGGAEHRRKLLSGLQGRVVEVGAGSGAKLHRSRLPATKSLRRADPTCVSVPSTQRRGRPSRSLSRTVSPIVFPARRSHSMLGL